MKTLKKGKRAFQKIAMDILDATIKTLNNSELPRAKRVHEARKHFKELRGLLRLIRYSIGKKTYKKENQIFRNAGRPLSQVRDAQAMIQTLNKLRRHYKKRAPKKSVQTLQRMLNKRNMELSERVLDKAETLKDVSAIIKKAINRAEDWPVQAHRWNGIGKGLRTTYKQGKSGLKRSLYHSTDEELHEWRKSVKYLRYQLEILSPLCEEILDDLAKKAHKLADLLGDDHDLVVLRELISHKFSGRSQQAKRNRFQKLIRKRRRELQQEAIELGSLLYAEKPKIYEWRIKKYWEAQRT